MGHGTPDWWGSEPGETTFQVQDVGELAVRLGSVDRHDRRGNVLFIDSFEDGLPPYSTYAFLAGSSVNISTKTSRSGAYSCKLATGALDTAYAVVRRFVPYPALTQHGFEVSFTLDDNAVDVQIYLSLWDGVNQTQFRVKYLPASDKWQYFNSAGAWVNLATGVPLQADYQFFHTAKLVVDLENAKYFYLLWDSDEVSMAGIAGRSTASVTSPGLEAGVQLDGGAAAAATIYLDDVIITQNEP